MTLQVRKLSEVEGEDSLAVVGEIIAPITEIASDKAVESAVKEKDGNFAKAIRVAIEKHNKAIYDMLAALSIDADTGKRVTRKQYIDNCNAIMIMVQLTEVLSDPPMRELFLSQVQTDAKNASGSATETTTASEK